MLKRFALPILVGCGVVALCAPSGAGAAVLDPERTGITPTGWHGTRDLTEAQLRKVAADNKERIADVELSTRAGRYTAVLVRNTGAYKRTWGWDDSATEAQIVAKLEAKKARLIDIEPHMRNGKVVFAYVWVRNTGDAGKGWGWAYGRSPAKIRQELKKDNNNIIDVDRYQQDALTPPVYSYVAVHRAGPDAGVTTIPHFGLTLSQVQEKAVEEKARILDLEREASGRWTVILQRGDQGGYTRHFADRTFGQVNHFVQSHGLRLTDLETYRKAGKQLFSGVALDNVSGDTSRVRFEMLGTDYAKGSYFGAYSKRIGGSTVVGLAHRMRYQPMSVMKIVNLLFALDELDKGGPKVEDLQKDTIPFPYRQADPDAQVCLDETGNDIKHNTTRTLHRTLERAMWESLNQAHEAMLNVFGPASVTSRMHSLGLTDTTVFHGCQYQGEKDWLSSRTTLVDMGDVFEGVDLKRYFKNDWKARRDDFYHYVVDWGKDELKAIVKQEAGTARAGRVDDFVNAMVVDGKGGGVNNLPSGKAGRAWSGRLVLPTQSASGPKRSYVGGFFAWGFPYVCHEGQTSDPDASCRAAADRLKKAWAVGFAEPFRVPIREAIATWPPG